MFFVKNKAQLLIIINKNFFICLFKKNVYYIMNKISKQNLYDKKCSLLFLTVGFTTIDSPNLRSTRN